MTVSEANYVLTMWPLPLPFEDLFQKMNTFIDMHVYNSFIYKS